MTSPTRFCRLLLVAALLGGAVDVARARPGQSFEEARSHWAYQPLRRPEPPRVNGTERVRTPVDAFLLGRLEKAGLTYSPPADPRTRLRRLYFDLIGMPPTYEEIEAFRRDPSPTAWARIVDQLLADPRYGERWGRHWLDVARYADTKDQVLLYGKDALRPYAYTYRDYVIRAFNEDLPLNEFIRDQLAADLVQPPLPRWRLAGLGFLTLGRMFDGNTHDQIDDQIDTVTRGLLGLTVACARCHDHKYDAITMDDYYGLYGVFASTERPYLPPLIEDPSEVPGGVEFEAKLAAAVAELENHIDAEYTKLIRVMRQRVGDYLVRAATTAPDITETSQFALSLTPEDFRPTLMLRMRRLLEQRLKSDDRVFGLWAELAELPDEDFATRASELIDNALRETEKAADRNQLVLSYLAAHRPETKSDLPGIYAALLKDFDKGLDSRTCPPGAFLPTRDERELLSLLTGPDSPVWFPWRDTPNHMSRPDKDRYHGLVLNLDKIAAHASQAPPARAMVVADLPSPYPARIFTRGNPSRPGASVPRAFVRLLTDGEAVPFKEGSGRLELAQAITSGENPLTPRVLVNRVWMHHFGEPLVGSTADFGTRSDPPRDPELLDWLATELIESGWRLKHLHRLLVLSEAYQQSSTGWADTTSKEPCCDGCDGCEEAECHETTAKQLSSSRAREIDPDNHLLWHYPRRRLDLEAMRDSLLFVSGRLDNTMGGRAVDLAGDPANGRRTVYGLVDRQNLPALYRAFDFAVPDQCAERRPLTSVPQQALFALNSPFVIEQARAFAAHPEICGITDECQRVTAMFQRALGRPPSEKETELARKFVEEPAPDSRLSAWEQLAQVLLVSNEALFLD